MEAHGESLSSLSLLLLSTLPFAPHPRSFTGKRNMCSIHSWCGLQLASPGPVGPTRGGRSVSSSFLRRCLSALLTRRPHHTLPEGCAAGPEDPRHSERLGRALAPALSLWLIPEPLPVARTRSTEYKVLPGLALSEQSEWVAFVVFFFRKLHGFPL